MICNIIIVYYFYLREHYGVTYLLEDWDLKFHWHWYVWVGSFDSFSKFHCLISNRGESLYTRFTILPLTVWLTFDLFKSLAFRKFVLLYYLVLMPAIQRFLPMQLKAFLYLWHWNQTSLAISLIPVSHFQVAFTPVAKRVLVPNLLYGYEIFLHFCCLANQTHFHMKGSVPGLVLKQR